MVFYPDNRSHGLSRNGCGCVSCGCCNVQGMIPMRSLVVSCFQSSPQSHGNLNKCYKKKTFLRNHCPLCSPCTQSNIKVHSNINDPTMMYKLQATVFKVQANDTRMKKGPRNMWYYNICKMSWKHPVPWRPVVMSVPNKVKHGLATGMHLPPKKQTMIDWMHF